ncbi:hypothetical protein [Streptosporangium sp. NPDC051022]|uniref:hypothetical protein n=1 Tax=Streptosporangium sp. NPDC051022 TaxID=3155752 RepID=UPI003446096A
MALLVSGAGCAITPGPSITRAQAMAVVNRYLGETFRAVKGPVFTRVFPLDSITGCEYFADTGPTGQVAPGVEYQTDKIGTEEAQQYMAEVAAYWERDPRARVERQTRGDGVFDGVEIRPFGDRYRLHVSYYPPPGIAQVYVMGALEDCIWENGTAPPAPDVLDPSFLAPS